jgi:hypothetical protein
LKEKPISMKTKFFLLCLPLFLAIAINAVSQTTAKKSVASESKKAITPLIIYDVIIFDTTKVETIAHQYSGADITAYQRDAEHKYLNLANSKIFKNEMNALIKRKNALFCNGWDFTPLTTQQLGKKITVEMTIQETDSLGNPLSTKTVADSIEMERWQKVVFYESWSFDKKTGMISKEVLAYGFYWFNEGKELWIPLFAIVKDEETRKKLIEMTGY